MKFVLLLLIAVSVVHADTNFLLGVNSAGKLTNGTRNNFAMEGDAISCCAHWFTSFTNYAGVPAVTGVSSNAAASGDFTTNFANTYTAEIYPIRRGGGTNAYLFEQGGANDIGTGGSPIYPADVIFKAKTSYWAQARADGFKICAITVTPRTGWAGNPDMHGAQTNLNAQIVAASNLWDYCYRADLMFPDSSDTTYYTDGTHPTQARDDLQGLMIATNLLPVFQTTISGPVQFSGAFPAGAIQ